MCGCPPNRTINHVVQFAFRQESTAKNHRVNPACVTNVLQRVGIKQHDIGTPAHLESVPNSFDCPAYSATLALAVWSASADVKPLATSSANSS